MTRQMPPEFALTEDSIDADRHVVAVRGEIDLFTAPVLTGGDGAPGLPLPAEPGYAWSWLAREGTDWVREPVATADEQFPETLVAREGWLALRPSPTDT